MKSYTWWETGRHPIRWTLYVGAAGEGKHRHRLRLDRLSIRTKRVRKLIFLR
jgi:hypothetical protein